MAGLSVNGLIGRHCPRYRLIPLVCQLGKHYRLLFHGAYGVHMVHEECLLKRKNNKTGSIDSCYVMLYSLSLKIFLKDKIINTKHIVPF